MRLLKMQIQDFRCVEDSQAFSLSGVTCLVGKNESGKTALLKALHKLKPDEAANEAFEPAKDYPRRKWRPDTAIPAAPPAISTTWELEDADMATLEQRFGSGAIRKRVFTLSKGYDNVRCFDIDIDQATGFGSKDDHVAQLRSGPIVGSFAIEDPRLLVFAPDAVLLAYRATFTPTGKADPQVVHTPYTCRQCRNNAVLTG